MSSAASAAESTSEVQVEKTGKGAEVMNSAMVKIFSVFSSEDTEIAWEDKVAVVTEACKTETALKLGTMKVGDLECPVPPLYSSAAYASIARAVGKMLEGNATMQTLRLTKMPIGSEGAIAIAEGLWRNASLWELAVQGCKIGDMGAAGIAEMLKHNGALVSLTLTDSTVGEEGVKDIAKSLGKNASLRILRILAVPFGDAGAKSIGKAIGKGSSLTSLLLVKGDISGKGCAAIAEGIRSGGALSHLHIETCPRMGESGSVKALAEAIGESTSTLRTVYLSECDLNDGHVEDLIASLCKEECPLEELILERAPISDVGASLLGDLIGSNTGLKILDLSGNPITDEGAAHLAEGLKSNSNLSMLILNDVTLTHRFMEVLADSLEVNMTLLDLVGSFEGVPGYGKVKGLLHRNNEMRQ